MGLKYNDSFRPDLCMVCWQTILRLGDEPVMAARDVGLNSKPVIHLSAFPGFQRLRWNVASCTVDD